MEKTEKQGGGGEKKGNINKDGKKRAVQGRRAQGK